MNERNMRRLVNNKLHRLGLSYHDGLPLDAVNAILHMHGFSILEPAIYCGRDGQSHEQVGPKTWLSLSWHKMDVTGRYEVVAYVN